MVVVRCCGLSFVACICFCGCVMAWLLIHGYFSCSCVLWLNLSCRNLFPRSDLHPYAANVEFLQGNDLFSPLLLNDRSNQFETF